MSSSSRPRRETKAPKRLHEDMTRDIDEALEDELSFPKKAKTKEKRKTLTKKLAEEDDDDDDDFDFPSEDEKPSRKTAGKRAPLAPKSQNMGKSKGKMPMPKAASTLKQEAGMATPTLQGGAGRGSLTLHGGVTRGALNTNEQDAQKTPTYMGGVFSNASSSKGEASSSALTSKVSAYVNDNRFLATRGDDHESDLENDEVYVHESDESDEIDDEEFECEALDDDDFEERLDPDNEYWDLIKEEYCDDEDTIAPLITESIFEIDVQNEDVARFQRRFRELVTALVAWADRIAYDELRDAKHTEKGRGMTLGFWILIKKMRVDAILAKVLPAISQEVQSILGRSNITFQDLRLLPANWRMETGRGIYADFPTGPSIDNAMGSECYIGSATNKRGGIKTRVNQHYKRSQESFDAGQKSRHYATICRSDVEPNFRVLAVFPEVAFETHRGYMLLLEGLFCVYFQSYKWRGPSSVHDYASSASYDTVQTVYNGTTIPTMDWMGLNGAWPLFQGFANAGCHEPSPCKGVNCDVMTQTGRHSRAGGRRALAETDDPLEGGYHCRNCHKYKLTHGQQAERSLNLVLQGETRKRLLAEDPRCTGCGVTDNFMRANTQGHGLRVDETHPNELKCPGCSFEHQAQHRNEDFPCTRCRMTYSDFRIAGDITWKAVPVYMKPCELYDCSEEDYFCHRCCRTAKGKTEIPPLSGKVGIEAYVRLQQEDKSEDYVENWKEKFQPSIEQVCFRCRRSRFDDGVFVTSHEVNEELTDISLCAPCAHNCIKQGILVEMASGGKEAYAKLLAQEMSDDYVQNWLITFGVVGDELHCFRCQHTAEDRNGDLNYNLRRVPMDSDTYPGMVVCKACFQNGRKGYVKMAKKNRDFALKVLEDTGASDETVAEWKEFFA